MKQPYRITLAYNNNQRFRFRQRYHAAGAKGSVERAGDLAQYITDLHDACWIPKPKEIIRCTIRIGSITRHFDHLPSASTLLQARL